MSKPLVFTGEKPLDRIEKMVGVRVVTTGVAFRRNSARITAADRGLSAVLAGGVSARCTKLAKLARPSRPLRGASGRGRRVTPTAVYSFEAASTRLVLRRLLRKQEASKGAPGGAPCPRCGSAALLRASL